MLKALRRHRLVRGCVEVLMDAVLYLGVMLVVIMVLGQLATRILCGTLCQPCWAWLKASAARCRSGS